MGASLDSSYTRIKRYGVPEEERKAVDSEAEEMRRLKAELKRVTEERDILKKVASYCRLARTKLAYQLDCSALKFL